MNGFIVVLALSWAAGTSEMSWSNDYGRSLEAAKAEQKPLLVVLDVPRDPLQRLDQLAVLPEEGDAELLRDYKRCHIDVSTEYGRRVAAAFKTTTFPHTVIIDRTASVKIFKKDGKFATQQEWRKTLVAHRQGKRKERRELLLDTFRPLQFSSDNCFT